MTITPEEVDESLNTSVLAPVSRWSFLPIQSIPRSADSLWNLIDTVYFAHMPEGHEVVECLKSSLNSSSIDESFPAVVELPGLSVCLSYNSNKKDSTPSQSGDVSLVFSVEKDTPCLLYSSVYLPLQEPRKVPEEPSTYTCVEAVYSEKMETGSFLQSLLMDVRRRKRSIIQSVLSKIESEVRVNKKSWMEKEEAVLALFDKKPPSSFHPTAALLASTGTSVAPSASLSLNQLGKVDSSLPDSFKDVELCCSVCLEGDTTDDNDILICDGCSFATHQNCYFVHSIPSGQWFCQLCQIYFEKKSKKSRHSNEQIESFLESTTCTLCLQSALHPGGGVMKPTNAQKWAHMKCATWVPEAAFPPDGLTITVMSHSSREELRCTVCKLKGGCPLQCAFGKCTVAFHVACAASVGLLPAEKSLTNLFCQRHVKIQLKTSPTISRLLSLRKQDGYLKIMNEKLICPKIGGTLISRDFNWEKDAYQFLILKLIRQHSKITSKQQTAAIMDDFFDEFQPIVAVADTKGFNQSVFVDLNCCSECMRTFGPNDPKLHCTECNLLVDPLCYERAGIPYPNVEDLGLWSKTMKWKSPVRGTTDFVCERCESKTLIAATYCVLCMQLGGVVRQLIPEDDEDTTIPPGWVHPRCLWWFLASGLVSLTIPPVLQLKSISSSYHFHPCSVCGSRLGCTLRCSRAGCTRRFHVSCGFHAGCYFTVRGSSERAVIAGMRDGEDEEEVVRLFQDASSVRRITTCWAHEQRGNNKPAAVRRGPLELAPHAQQIVRWVPDGIKSELVTLVNQVMYGEIDLAVTAYGKPKKVVEAKVRPEPKSRETKRKRDRFSTVRFIDGEEVLCEEEEWEGGCSLCGKAWLASGELESICCDKCDQWYHFKCVGIDKPPSGAFACPKCL